MNDSSATRIQAIKNVNFKVHSVDRLGTTSPRNYATYFLREELVGCHARRIDSTFHLSHETFVKKKKNRKSDETATARTGWLFTRAVKNSNLHRSRDSHHVSVARMVARKIAIIRLTKQFVFVIRLDSI